MAWAQRAGPASNRLLVEPPMPYAFLFRHTGMKNRGCGLQKKTVKIHVQWLTLASKLFFGNIGACVVELLLFRPIEYGAVPTESESME